MNIHKSLIRGFKIYECELCQRLTRVTNECEEEAYSFGDCSSCNEDALKENSHINGHDGSFDPNCKACKGEPWNWDSK